MKKHRYIRKYISFLRNYFRVPPIKTTILWKYPSVITDDGNCGFGLFLYPNATGQRPEEIYVGAKKIGLTGVMSVLAHEYAHYRQYIEGEDMEAEHIEDEAERRGLEAMGAWLLRRK